MLAPCCYATFNPDTKKASHDEHISLALQSKKQLVLLGGKKKNKLQGAIRQTDVTMLCFIWRMSLLGTSDNVQAIFGEGYPCLTQPCHLLCLLSLPTTSLWCYAKPPKSLPCPSGLSPMTNSF